MKMNRKLPFRVHFRDFQEPTHFLHKIKLAKERVENFLRAATVEKVVAVVVDAVEVVVVASVARTFLPFFFLFLFFFL